MSITFETLPQLHEIAFARQGWLTALAWSPDSQILMASGDGVVFYQRDGLTLLGHLRAHTAPIKDIALSADGGRLASGSSDESAAVWDVRAQPVKPVWGISNAGGGAIEAVALHPSGEQVATAGEGHSITLWSTHSRQPVRVLSEHSHTITALVYQPFKTDALTGVPTKTDDSSVGMPYMASAVSSPSTDDFSVGTPVRASDSDKTAVSLLASGSWDKTVRLWDIQAGECRAIWDQHDLVRDLALSPDGTALAVSSKDGVVSVADFLTLHEFIRFQAHEGGSDCLAFHPDGELLATGGRDRAVRLWRWRDGALLHSLPDAHKRPVMSLAFSPDGRTLATGGGDHRVKLWMV